MGRIRRQQEGDLGLVTSPTGSYFRAPSVYTFLISDPKALGRCSCRLDPPHKTFSQQLDGGLLAATGL